VSITAGLELLAILLRGHGLSATSDESPSELRVSNPIASTLFELVGADDAGCYITAWGYAFGQVGQEGSAADRLAFLLGVPSRRRCSRIGEALVLAQNGGWQEGGQS